MKHYFTFILLTLVSWVFIGQAHQAYAQQSDTLVVEWLNEQTGDVIVNSLRDAIALDTERPEGRVYKLKRGGYYWLTGRIENDGFHLRIVGEKPGSTLEEAPAVIQMVEDAEGNVDGRILTGLASVTLKNLWLTGHDNTGVQTYYQPIQMDASDSQFLIENCVLTRTNFALIAFTGTNNDIMYKDCVFRNLIGKPSTQQWEGRGISIWADQDSVIVENCTFFNIGMTAFQLEGGAANYARFNHNTLVNIGRGITSGNWWREGYFANNLVVNGFWHGEGNIDLTDPSREPDRENAGMISIGALPSIYGPEQGRRILVANTATWRDPAFATYYADSLVAQPLLDNLSMRDYFNVYDNIVEVDNQVSDFPGLITYDPDLTAQIPDMIQNIEDLRAGVTPANPYFWQLPTNPDGSVCEVCINWPLPEDFSYTNNQLLSAGSDGLPLGDLNWFPIAKDEFEANKEQYIADLEAKAGEKISFEVTETVEAENGTLGGDAAVESFQGFSYFQMDGGGYMEWTFDLATGGEYDLNIWTHMRSNAQRGQHTYINGVAIHDAAHGWGELIYDNALGVTTGMVIDDWTWVRWTQADLNEAGALTFPAGQNVIKIESSWGWQHFAGFDLLQPGTETVVASLRAPDVTDYAIVMPIGEGAPWTPNGFKSVALNTSGSISWNMNVPSDGRYRFQLFFQNYNATQTAEIQIDGQSVLSSVEITANTDSTGQNVLSDNFSLTAGAHTVTLIGNDFNVDYIQLIKEISTSVKASNKLPEGYELSQNYPNPFNPVTNIRFTLGKLSHVNLSIYNVLGQKMITLVDKRMAAGIHHVTWDASNMATGLYFYTLETANHKKTLKMMLIR